MPFLGDLRKRLHLYLLNKRIGTVQSDSTIVNYNEAQKVGVLYNASDPAEVALVSKYMHGLQQKGKHVKGLAYIPDHKQAAEVTADHFTDKNVNWLFVPSGMDVESFMKERFDLLVNLYTRPCLPLEYIAALSEARYKVGRYIEDKTYCFDLMVYLDEQKGLGNMIKEVDHLLTEINKHKYVEAV